VLAGSFTAVLDTTIVNVALPSIEQGAHASSDALEWVVSGYALAFGLALVPAGRVGDRFGYKRLFLAGLTLFTLASVACGIAANAGELILARLVRGLGAGIYYPAISAIIQRLFTGRDRSRAFGYRGGVVGVSTAVGPLLGGVIVQLAGEQDGWRWVFLVNLFIGAVAIPVAWRLVPGRHQPERHQLDPVGNGLLAVVLLLLLIPLVEGRVTGWPAGSWLMLGLVLSGARPGFWPLAAPLLLAGLGNGLVIAPNQDFVLGSVPREQAGTAGGALITGQRLGAAIGIAVIGTALFGSGSSGGAKVMPSLVHSAQLATAVNLCFVAAAFGCAFGLPRRLADQEGEQPADRQFGPPGTGRKPAHDAEEQEKPGSGVVRCRRHPRRHELPEHGHLVGGVPPGWTSPADGASPPGDRHGLGPDAGQAAARRPG
jgi:MFS family permease